VSVLITNIGELVTNAPRDAVGVISAGRFDTISDAALVLDDGLVAWTGPVALAPAADDVTDAAGRAADRGFTDVIVHWPRPDGPYAGDERVLETVAADLLATSA